MELKEILEKRKSCRKYTDEILSNSDIKKILWAGNRAPYASGGPRRKYYVVRDKNTKLKMKGACHKQPYVFQCDTIIVICGFDKGKGDILRSGFNKFVHDCDAAAMCMILQATELNIGNCWIGHFKVEEVQNILNIKTRPVVVLLMGREK